MSLDTRRNDGIQGDITGFLASQVHRQCVQPAPAFMNTAFRPHVTGVIYLEEALRPALQINQRTVRLRETGRGQQEVGALGRCRALMIKHHADLCLRQCCIHRLPGQPLVQVVFQHHHGIRVAFSQFLQCPVQRLAAHQGQPRAVGLAPDQRQPAPFCAPGQCSGHIPGRFQYRFGGQRSTTHHQRALRRH